ncbi:MAG: bacterial proteasome activator family protein [Aeromicrobium sp.]|uniref:bacterial proteasome activator family protein n=1 Tax=Aeromicrobium sp. TaxID=1871063 RepID=UPI0039E68636
MSETPMTIEPDGTPVAVPATADEPAADTPLTDLVEQPAKVMRIGGMIRQLLEEVKAAPLDEASRARLREIHEQSIAELKDGLAPELVEELSRLSRPFEAVSPTEGELRIAQAQLVGWLEGLFHGIQAALYAQQVQAQSQLQTMRLALPSPDGSESAQPEQFGNNGSQGGMYL